LRRRFFIHIEQACEPLSNPKAYGDEAVRAIMDEVWPFGDPRPRVYYDARALTPRPRFNMHAKCVIVDGECALITSANFTRRAQEQNTECGVLLEAPTFAHHLARQWLGLIDAGLVMESVVCRRPRSPRSARSSAGRTENEKPGGSGTLTGPQAASPRVPLTQGRCVR
jgi:phosphatidylserine/phosphatidylglycerophosphate/cardiolipin synthase-like enzyme